MARVRQRVKENGHNLAEDVVRRRFKTGWNHFGTLYKGLVDEWVLIDNSGEWPIVLDEGERHE